MRSVSSPDLTHQKSAAGAWQCRPGWRKALGVAGVGGGEGGEEVTG